MAIFLAIHDDRYRDGKTREIKLTGLKEKKIVIKQNNIQLFIFVFSESTQSCFTVRRLIVYNTSRLGIIFIILLIIRYNIMHAEIQ